MQSYFKKFPFISLVLSLSFLFPTITVAMEKTLSLEDCLQMARSRNPAVLASIERKVQAEWKKKATYNDFLPKLNMEYGYTYIDDTYKINTDFIGIDEVNVSVHDNYKMGLHIDQPLFTGYRLMETYRLADLGLKVATADEQLANLEITFQTVRAYYNHLKAQKFQNVADDAVTQLTSHLNDSEQFYKNEIIPLNDLLESKVHLANAKQDANNAASRARVARMTLATIIKEPLSQALHVVDSPDTVGITSNAESLSVQALEMRPELQQANYNVDAAKKQIILAKSNYFPTVVLSASHNRYGGDAWVDGDGISDLQTPDESMVGVYATWELFAWGQTKYRVNQAQAASREAAQTLTAVMDEIQFEVQDYYSNALTAYDNIETAETAVEQARENLRMNELRYRNQISTNTNVLDARTLLTQTETKYYQAVYDYNIRLAGLARAVGVKSWKDLEMN